MEISSGNRVEEQASPVAGSAAHAAKAQAIKANAAAGAHVRFENIMVRPTLESGAT